ncbi:MAG: TIGR04255 family protein [Desulfuromonadales bacterium]|nr:TIGR04255 family protein [Desulfuromonadales bacterium]
MNKVIINIAEEFPVLRSAPIVEAVIDIRAFPVKPFEESAVRSSLEEKLGGYSFLDSHHEIHHEVRFDGEKPPEPVMINMGWKGARFQSSDQKNIAQFNRDGFVFSRLAPYQDWQSFSQEGKSLWSVFKEIADPATIGRIGLRFINRIELPPGELDIEQYLRNAPAPPANLDLPFLGFMHQETLVAPGHPYAINLIRTIQPPQNPSVTGIAVILDIDVFTIESIAQPVENDDNKLAHSLHEMRWLKDKAFFGSITESGLERFK